MNGCQNDKGVYKKSKLKEDIRSCLNGPAVLIGGYQLPQYIVADSGFCNDGNLLTPFTMRNVSFALDDKQ